MAIDNMPKSYMKLIGILQGKQAKHNIQILTILFDNGPLTAWEITGKIQKVGRQSLHATFNKRLRSLEKKKYLRKEDRKWFLQFKGFIVGLLIKKTPKPPSDKWFDILDEVADFAREHSGPFLGATIRVNDTIINPPEIIDETRKNLRELNTTEIWIEISNSIKKLMETGVINLDLISNQTLLAIVLSEGSYADLEALMKSWTSPSSET